MVKYILRGKNMSINKIGYKKTEVRNGYTNHILKVNLSNNSMLVNRISEETKEMFIGGRGYCLKEVFKGTKSSTKYDSEENVFTLAGGPFCGETGFTGTGKFIIGSISPLTNTFCDSNVGGYFFPIVKQAGFDAISITGKSDKEVVVFIDGDNGEIKIIEAPDQNISLFNAEKIMEQFKGDGKLSSVSFVSAGIGSKNTHLGCVNSVYYDVRRKRCRAKQAGRGGMGTVMKEKGLWGVIVKYDLSKSNSNNPIDKPRVREAGKKLRKIITQVDPTELRLAKQGTTSLLDIMNDNDILPVHNYQFGRDSREKEISGKIFENKIFDQKHPDGCFAGCNLSCTKGCEQHTLTTGPFKGKTIAVDGPEYETAAAITNLGIFDIPSILEYAWYCDEYAIDTISTGVVMAFLIEAYQRNILTDDDTEGMELKWNDKKTVFDLLHKVAGGESIFPKEVGKGIRHMKGWIADKASLRQGVSKSKILEELNLFGMETKGLEFSMYITKESLAQQGGYGFALKGPQHDEAWLIALDQVKNEMPTFEKKAAALKWFPLFRTWFNIVGLCKLPWIDVRHPEASKTNDPAKNFPTIEECYLEITNATLGTEKSIDDLLLESERCHLLHKLINLRQGYGTREHDSIPLRAMAPVFMDEFNDRKDYYIDYLINTVNIDTKGKTDEDLLKILHEYRKNQYEKLTDSVYEEKGYDLNSIPLDETMKKLNMYKSEYLSIVKEARSRIAN